MTVVFISHSSREREETELRATDSLDSHRRRKVFLRRLIDRLSESLVDHDYDPWVDREQLAAGDFFDEPIALALGRCEVAVVLVDLDALDSAYVMREVTTLMFRHVGDGITVIPVILRSARHEFVGSNLDRQTGLGRASVLDTSAKNDNFQAIEPLVTAIVGRVSAVAPPRLDSPEALWIQEFAEQISDLPRGRLWPLAEMLGFERERWRNVPEPASAIATVLLSASLDTVQRALMQLARLLKSSPSRQSAAVDLALPLWVDLDDARIVRELSRSADDRICLVATEALRLGGHIVDRATQRDPLVDVVGPPDCVGEDAYADLFRRYAEEVRLELHLGRDDTPETIRGQLDRMGTKAFVLVRVHQLPGPVAAHLLTSLCAAYPGVVIVGLAGPGSPVRLHIRAVKTGPAPEREDAGRRYVSRLMGLRGETVDIHSNG